MADSNAGGFFTITNAAPQKIAVEFTPKPGAAAIVIEMTTHQAEELADALQRAALAAEPPA